MRTMLICGAILASGPATAAPSWVYVAESSLGSVYYSDAQSQTTAGNLKTAWRKIDSTKDKTVKWREAKQLWLYRCDRAQTALKAYVNYRADGTILTSEEIPEYEIEWKTVIPESVGEALFQFVCNGVR